MIKEAFINNKKDLKKKYSNGSLKGHYHHYISSHKNKQIAAYNA